MLGVIRVLTIVSVIWFGGAYLTRIIPRIYYRSDIAFLGYVVAIFLAVVINTIVFKTRDGFLAGPQDVKTGLWRLAGGVAVAWLGGDRIGAVVFQHAPWVAGFLPRLWAGYVVGFPLGVMLTTAILTAQEKRGGYTLGHGWDLILRPIKGWAFKLVLLALPVLLAGGLIMATSTAIEKRFGIEGWFNGNVTGVPLAVLAAFAAVIALPLRWLLHHHPEPGADFYRWLGQRTRPMRNLYRQTQFGKGGEAAFAGMFSEFENIHSPGEILLGACSYDDTFRIGVKSDKHLLTFASSGGGKGRGSIIPNLLLWPHSVLVIDPKGTNAAVTALARGYGGGGLQQDVFVLDPFRQLRNQGVAIDSACYNPLLDLDAASPRFFEDIKAVAEGLVIPNPDAKDPFWDNKARDWISGFVEFVVDTEREDNRTLMQVHDLLTGKSQDEFEGLLDRMIGQGRAGGMAQKTARDIQRVMESNTYRNIITTIDQDLDWVASPPMRKVLKSSDFSLADLQDRPTSVYLVLPPEELDTHNRFLRLFVSIGLRAVFRRAEIEEGGAPKKKTPVLFVLDEFLALGRINAMIRAVNVGRSYGLKVWPICQSVTGLFDVYGRSAAQNFIDAAGAIQVFSVGNQESAQWLSDAIGVRDIIRPTADGQFSVVSGVALRSGLEVQAETERDMNKQFIIRHGKRPLYLTRYPYDKYFDKDEYSPDPDHS